MAIIRTEIVIHADAQVCFDLARDVDVHVRSAQATGERAVAGVTTGRLNLGDSVTWRGRHFGLVQDLTSRITIFEPARHFRDEMVSGPFKRLVHDHYFEAIPGATRMVNIFDFNAPWGVIGKVAESLFLTSYLRRFLERRGRMLKDIAETGRR